MICIVDLNVGSVHASCADLKMFAISHPNADTAGAGAIITLDPDVIEPPAKRRATEANDDFNVLFGCSDNTEQEAVHALDDDIDDEMQRYLHST